MRPKPGLDLVGDEDDPVAIADAPQAVEELRRSDDEASLALNRLDDDRRDGLGRDRAVVNARSSACERVRGGDPAVGVRERHPVDLGRERAETGLVGMHLGGHGQREQRAAVERAVEDDDGRTPRVGAGELDRVLDRLGAGVEERRLQRAGDRDALREPLGERDVRLVRDDREVGVGEAIELLVRRRQDLGMRRARR